MHRRDLLRRSTSALCCAMLAATGGLALPAWANEASSAELTRLSVQHVDETLLLSYDIRLTLHKDVEQLMSKGVAIVFVAQARVFERRWYWTDKHITTKTRRWRVAYQPLTRQWRVNFDGFSRSYGSLQEVIEVMRQGSQWLLSDKLDDIDASDCYVDFSFKLDANELPRPLQIGLGGQDGWTIDIERRVNVSR